MEISYVLCAVLQTSSTTMVPVPVDAAKTESTIRVLRPASVYTERPMFRTTHRRRRPRDASNNGAVACGLPRLLLLSFLGVHIAATFASELLESTSSTATAPPLPLTPPPPLPPRPCALPSPAPSNDHSADTNTHSRRVHRSSTMSRPTTTAAANLRATTAAGSSSSSSTGSITIFEKDFSRPMDIPEEGIEAAVAVMRSGRLFRYSCASAEGSQVALAEREFAQVAGARFAVGVNSCSSAILIALLGVGVRAGDQVLTNAFTFTAVPSAVLRAGAEPVLVECSDRYIVREYCMRVCVCVSCVGERIAKRLSCFEVFCFLALCYAGSMLFVL